MSKTPRLNGHGIGFIFTIILLCVFTATALVVVFIGSNVYKNTASNMEDAFAGRTALSFVAKQIRQYDSVESISVGTVEEAQALIFKEETPDGVFFKYIYYYDNYLRELYANEDFEPTGSSGQPLVLVDGFSVSDNQNGTITYSITSTSGAVSQATMAIQSQK